jgi:hypothetical protein
MLYLFALYSEFLLILKEKKIPVRGWRCSLVIHNTCHSLIQLLGGPEFNPQHLTVKNQPNKNSFRYTLRIWENIFSLCFSLLCWCLQSWSIGFSSSNKTWTLTIHLECTHTHCIMTFLELLKQK